MGNPSISERRYFREIPGAAEEPTSTIVLTSHNSHYVDVRIFKPQNDAEPELPNEGGPMARLEWAFAGTSHTEPAVPEPGNTKPWRSVWKHWVDSKSDDPKPDEADMWPQPNGDTLEKGSTRDPDTGVVSEYEELWAELPVEKTGADEGFFSVVLQLQDDVRSAKGLIVRVGQWCEGLLKIGSDVTVERWKWVPEGSESLGQKSSTGGESKLPTVINGSHSATPERKDDQTQSEFGGNWTRIARLGARFLPCAATFDPDMARQGTVVEAGDFTWNVIESYQW